MHSDSMKIVTSIMEFIFLRKIIIKFKVHSKREREREGGLSIISSLTDNDLREKKNASKSNKLIRVINWLINSVRFIFNDFKLDLKNLKTEIQLFDVIDRALIMMSTYKHNQKQIVAETKRKNLLSRWNIPIQTNK